MEKFTELYSRAVPLPMENIDTDQIIPARFLKATTRSGFGENLFRDWRYERDTGLPKSSFVLNNPIYEGRILVAGKNFGCGSSREHAAWALYDHGFRAIISSFFADIFMNNALNNGLLPIAVSPEFLDEIFLSIEENPRSEFKINLQEQTFEIVSNGRKYDFSIDAYKKMCLLKGYQDIDYLLSLLSDIETFEKQQVIF